MTDVDILSGQGIRLGGHVIIAGFLTVRELLEAWVSAECGLAAEYSDNVARAYRETVDRAKATADNLGVPWDEDIVPGFIMEAIEADDVL